MILIYECQSLQMEVWRINPRKGLQLETKVRHQKRLFPVPCGSSPGKTTFNILKSAVGVCECSPRNAVYNGYFQLGLNLHEQDGRSPKLVKRLLWCLIHVNRDHNVEN